MSNFEYIFKRTGINEGGSSNDHNDTGGYTYKGISSKHNKGWDGFAIIQGTAGAIFGKRVELLNKFELDKLDRNLDNNITLQNLVRDKYYHDYYVANGIHNIEDEMMAYLVFEMGFMSGNRGLRICQLAVNIFYQSSRLAVDGKIGPKTVEQLNKITSDSLLNTKAFYSIMISTYFGYLSNCPTWDKHQKGWFSRWIRNYNKAVI